MKMPELTIENYEKVYEYFRDFKPSQKIARRWFTFTSIVFKSRVQYAEEARKDLDLVREKDYHHIYAFNHQDDWDGYVFFSVIHQIMPQDEGRIRAMATSLCFESPLPQIFRGVGFIPVYLRAYYAKSRKHRNHPERLALVPAATKALLDCCTYIMTDHRQKIIICPEGTYNKGAPDTLLPIRNGAAEIAHRVAKLDGSVAITAIAVAYGKKRHRVVYPRNASAYVNRPIFVEPGMTVDEITELIRKRLQSSVEHAVKLY